MQALRALWEVQFLRFLVVGGFNTGLCYAVYVLLLLVAGLPFWAANAGALTFGICWSFFTMGRLVFGRLDLRRAVGFVAAWGLIYVVQTSAIALIMRTGIGPTLAGLIVLPAAAVLSFFIQKLVVFRERARVVA